LLQKLLCFASKTDAASIALRRLCGTRYERNYACCGISNGALLSALLQSF